MLIHLSLDDGSPKYEQIIQQIKLQVATGRLVPGDELPPIRVLAQQLLITPSTVARAYRELEVEGIVVKRQTTGTYISEASAELGGQVKRALLLEKIDHLLEDARRMGLPLKEVLALIRERAEETEES